MHYDDYDDEPHDDKHLDQLIADVRRVAGGANEGLRPHVRTLPQDDAATGPRSGMDRIFRTLTASAPLR